MIGGVPFALGQVRQPRAWSLGVARVAVLGSRDLQSSSLMNHESEFAAGHRSNRSQFERAARFAVASGSIAYCPTGPNLALLSSRLLANCMSG